MRWSSSRPALPRLRRQRARGRARQGKFPTGHACARAPRLPVPGRDGDPPPIASPPCEHRAHRRRRAAPGPGPRHPRRRGGALFVLITSLRGIASFYTDYLWFDSLGLSEVLRGVLGRQDRPGGHLHRRVLRPLWLNLVIADRLAPRFRPAGPEEEFIERYHELVGRRTGLVRGVVSPAVRADRRRRRVERVERVDPVHATASTSA